MQTSKLSDHRGITLVETVIAGMLVSVTLVAALHAVGASQRSQRLAIDRATASMLAEDLMNEIVVLPYEEPATVAAFGPETGETGTGRVGFDDVDDYEGWSGSPPVHRDGTAMPLPPGWARQVDVSFVANDGDLTETNSGVKLIDVQVLFNGRLLARLRSVRSASLSAAADDTLLDGLLLDEGSPMP